MKVAICIPSGDEVKADFAMCLVGLTMTAMRHGIHMALINEKSSIVQKGRHTLVEKALEIGADYLLFLDSDMTFPPETLVRLIQEGADIVAAGAVRRRPPHYSNVTLLDDSRADLTAHTGTKPVRRIGTAVMLVKADVFRKLGVPYFNVVWDEAAGGWIGEDYWFCDRARDAGYKIYCDFDLSKHIGHIGAKTHFGDTTVG